jgi:Family of unknown function (DUF5681)
MGQFRGFYANGTTQEEPMPFVKGQSGNPAGRPVGSRNRFTREMDEALEQRGLPLIDAIVGHAHAANPTAMRLCFQRVAGKQRPCAFQLPPLETPDYTVAAVTEVQRALGAGEITSEEAARLVDVIGRIVRVLASTGAAEIDFADRLARVEELLQLNAGDSIALQSMPPEAAPAAREPAIVNNNAKTMAPASGGAAKPVVRAPPLPPLPPPAAKNNEDLRVAAALDAAVRATLPRRESVKQQLMNSVSPSALLIGDITENVLAGKTKSVMPPLAPSARAA